MLESGWVGSVSEPLSTSMTRANIYYLLFTICDTLYTGIDTRYTAAIDTRYSVFGIDRLIDADVAVV